jgi:hypothetical protein
MTTPCATVAGDQMKRALALTSLLLTVLVVLMGLAGLSCGSDERLTLDEYAVFCADGIASARTLIEPESVTWGDLIELGAPSLERLRSVEPPEQLGEFHRASIKVLDFVVGVAEEQPSEELANPLAFGINALRIATQFQRAVDDLPDEVRRTLDEAGCL